MKYTAKKILLLLLFFIITNNAFSESIKNVKKFKDWNVVCKKIANVEKELCGITQIISSKDKKTSIQMSVTIPPNQKDKPEAIFRLPLGMLLQAGLEFSAGKEKILIPYRFCVNQGCIATIRLSKKLIGSMKSAKKGGVKFVTLDNKQYEAPISLSGFTSAFNYITK